MNEFEGIFFDFNSCLAECTSDYVDQEYDNIQINKFWSTDLSKNLDLPLEGRNVLIPFLRSVKQFRNFTLIDYGGGSNPIFSYFPSESRADIDYIVIDRPEFLELIERKRLPGNIRLAEDICNVSPKFRIKVLYFGSSVQYIHDHSVLSDCFEFGADWVILADTIFSTDLDYWVKQVNIEANSFPNHWWSVDTIDELAQKNFLSRVLRFKSGPCFNHDSGEKRFCETIIYAKL